jgi:hypothetical protein
MWRASWEQVVRVTRESIAHGSAGGLFDSWGESVVPTLRKEREKWGTLGLYCAPRFFIAPTQLVLDALLDEALTANDKVDLALRLEGH